MACHLNPSRHQPAAVHHLRYARHTQAVVDVLSQGYEVIGSPGRLSPHLREAADDVFIFSPGEGESAVAAQREILVHAAPRAVRTVGFPCAPRAVTGKHHQCAVGQGAYRGILAGMEQDIALAETRDAIGANRIGGTGWRGLQGIHQHRRCVAVLLVALPLRGKRLPGLGGDSGAVQTIAQIEGIAIDKGRSRAQGLPFIFQGNGGFVGRPCLEVGGGKMLEIMSATSQLASVATTVVEIEDVVASSKPAGCHIAHPGVVSFGDEILQFRLYLLSILNVCGACGISQGCIGNAAGIPAPTGETLSRGKAQDKVVVGQHSVHIKRKGNPGIVQHNLMPTPRLLQHGKRRTNTERARSAGIVNLTHLQSGLHHRHTTVGKRKGGIVLPVVLTGFLPTEGDGQHIVNGKNLAVRKIGLERCRKTQAETLLKRRVGTQRALALLSFQLGKGILKRELIIRTIGNDMRSPAPRCETQRPKENTI